MLRNNFERPLTLTFLFCTKASFFVESCKNIECRFLHKNVIGDSA